jgi:menaquinone-specific isochorismate synthase
MAIGIEPSAVREAAERELAASGAPVVRVELPLRGEAEPAAWLSGRREPVKVYWANRRGDFECAGTGVAVRETSGTPVPFAALFEKLRRHLNPRYTRLRFYGGAAFDRDMPVDEFWARYGAQQFVIPRYEVFREGERWHFACNWPRTDDVRDIERDLALRACDEPAELLVPPVLERIDEPDREGWCRGVAHVLAEIKAGRLAKAVLARRTRFTFAGALPVMPVLRHLREESGESHLFYFQPAAGTAFMSVSPELLAACGSGRIESEALAGTRPRGISPSTDAELSDDLLHNDKELREHGAVVKGIDEVFEKHCAEYSQDEVARVVLLRDCQHLVRRISGRLRDAAGAGAFLDALHPTPAVGGVSRGAALAAIRRIEPFSRGWYAGPIGWVGADGCEFAVGIRSGRIEEGTATLYAGAGLVSGSEHSREWDEVETKMQASIRLIRTGNNGRG